MLDVDLNLLTNLWWATASCRRYRPFLNGWSCTRSSTQEMADKLGIRLYTHALPFVGREFDKSHITDPARFHQLVYGSGGNSKAKEFWATRREILADSGLTEAELDGAISLLTPVIVGVYMADPVAVDALRQLAFLFYKLERPFDDNLVKVFL